MLTRWWTRSGGPLEQGTVELCLLDGSVPDRRRSLTGFVLVGFLAVVFTVAVWLISDRPNHPGGENTPTTLRQLVFAGG